MKSEDMLVSGLRFCSDGNDSSTLGSLPLELASNPVIHGALKRVNCVVRELLETEASYLQSLKELKDGYCTPLFANNRHDKLTLETIFSNIIPLYQFHSEFSMELCDHREDLAGISDVFLLRAVNFESLYVEFCLKHLSSIQALENEEQLNTELWSDIVSCQANLGHILPLATYLLKPVQRILKYQLLLQELIKGCKSVCKGDDFSAPLKDDLKDAIERLQVALERMIKVASHINEEKRCRELIDQLRNVGFDVDHWGRLLLRDVFLLPAKKYAWRLALLFDRAIVLGKPIARTSFVGSSARIVTTQLDALDYSGTTGSAPNLTEAGSNGSRRPPDGSTTTVLDIREIISCDKLMLIECINKNPLAFHILPFGNPKAQRTLQANSLQVKQTWCREIKRVILDNFDAAIPEKAKQLVLHMDELVGTAYAGFPLECESDFQRRKSTSILQGAQKRKGQLSSIAKVNSDILLSAGSASVTPSLPKASTLVTDSDNATSLIQDAWNTLLAKHTVLQRSPGASPKPLTRISSNGDEETREIAHWQNSADKIVEDDDKVDDFRCIAVEINEERFAVSAPMSTPQSDTRLYQYGQTDAAKQLLSSPMNHRRTSAEPLLKPNGTTRAVNTFQGPHPDSVMQSKQKRPAISGASLYINCHEASEYDTVTFGRAYEQYIKKTRAMSTISAGELNEILRPLLTHTAATSAVASPPRPRRVTPTDTRSAGLDNGVTFKQSVSLSGAANRNRPVDIGRIPEVSATVDSDDSSSGAVSPCQIVSRIAIDSNGSNQPFVTMPRKSYRPPPPPLETHDNVSFKPNGNTLASQNNGFLVADRLAIKTSTSKPINSVTTMTRTAISSKSLAPKPPRSDLRSYSGLSGSNNYHKTRTPIVENAFSPTKPLRYTGYTLPNTTKENDGDTEAASLCRGRVRAAFETLLNPHEDVERSKVVPTRCPTRVLAQKSQTYTDNVGSRRPSKPPRNSSTSIPRTVANSRFINRNIQLQMQQQPDDTDGDSKSNEFQRGRVQGLISRFQC